VIIEAEMNNQKLQVWQGRQQDLFRKYASKRTSAMKQIVSGLEDLKQDFDL